MAGIVQPATIEFLRVRAWSGRSSDTAGAAEDQEMAFPGRRARPLLKDLPAGIRFAPGELPIEFFGALSVFQPFLRVY